MSNFLPTVCFPDAKFSISTMASAFEWLTPFQCLRRLSLRCLNAFGVYRFAVSMPSAFIASLFQWLRRFSLRCFNGLRPFLGFNAFGVSRFAVQCLRRFSLRCLTSLRASPFNDFGVFRCAVLWLRRFSLRCFNGLRPFLGFNAFGVYRFAV